MQHPWYSYFLVELVCLGTFAKGLVRIYEKTSDKSARPKVQRKHAEPAITSYAQLGCVHFIMRFIVWYNWNEKFGHYNIYTGLTTFEFSIVGCIVRLIVYDFVATVLHILQHNRAFEWCNHKLHHSILSPTTETSSFIATVSLIVGQYVPLLVIGLLPLKNGHFWDFLFVTVFASTHRQLSHSERMHFWEESVIFRYSMLCDTRFHHTHHLIPMKNFAQIFRFWDILFGTYKDPTEVKGIY